MAVYLNPVAGVANAAGSEQLGQISYENIPCRARFKNPSLLTRYGRLGILTVMLILAGSVHATLRVWTGNATMSNSWTNALNWSGNVAPVPGDDLEFPFDAVKQNSSDNYTNGTTFNSILFWHGGSGPTIHYDLTGNSIALNAGISAVNSSVSLWDNTVNNAFLLNSNQTFATAAFTALAMFGAINLNGHNLTFDTAALSPIDVHGVISGAGGVIKTNPGTLTLYTNNTYSGSTTVSDGMLTLNRSEGISNSASIAVSGASAILNAFNGFFLKSGQTLSGIGSVSGDVIASPGSIISPGNNTLGILTFNNNLTLNPAATLIAVLNGTNAGTGYKIGRASCRER